ncbi:hypothetical protein Bca4012_009346 [Brassica carinata]|uniref:Uncharacterized protein n=1 Tax=Brassica carinata TaxID=52824 RepID=A0A8X7UZM3_BRACI|nr:hypothetical protein Bca52824_034612 [Brassica carinata]
MASSSEFDGILLGMENHFSTSPPSSAKTFSTIILCNRDRYDIKLNNAILAEVAEDKHLPILYGHEAMILHFILSDELE